MDRDPQPPDRTPSPGSGLRARDPLVGPTPSDAAILHARRRAAAYAGSVTAGAAVWAAAAALARSVWRSRRSR